MLEKISWTDPVRNERIFQRVKQEKNIIQTIKRRNDNWKGSFLCTNCLLKHTTEGKIEGRIEVMGIWEEDVSSYQMTLIRKDVILEIERGGTRLHSVGKTLC